MAPFSDTRHSIFWIVAAFVGVKFKFSLSLPRGIFTVPVSTSVVFPGAASTQIPHQMLYFSHFITGNFVFGSRILPPHLQCKTLGNGVHYHLLSHLHLSVNEGPRHFLSVADDGGAKRPGEESYAHEGKASQWDLGEP